MANFKPIDGGFLQSEEWEKFQKGIGRETFRIEEGDLRCLAIENKLPIVGGYFFVPRSPITSEILNPKSEILNNNEKRNYKFETKKFLDRLTDTARCNKVGWIRLEPQSFNDLEEIKSALGAGYKIKKSKKDHEPVQTLVIDLLQSEDEILAVMKPKTRYNIRLSEKKGVRFFQSKENDKVEKFLELMEETAKRDGITNHPKDYYRKMLQLIPDENISLILAEFEGKIIAGAVVVFYELTATYLHGASSNELRNLMAPFGLQWKAIRIAKEKRCKKYDFGGISVATERYPNPKKGWSGITRFKSGFYSSNVPVEFPGCWDIILNNKKYFIYRFLQGIKDVF